MAVPIPFLIITFLGIFAARLYPSVKTKYHVLGFSRPRDRIVNIHGERMIEIPHTPQCEDLHHHIPSGLLFTACEDEKDYDARRHWFPPLTLFDAKYATGQGKIVVIDPKTFQSTPLTFENFHGPFITHGIDVISSHKTESEVLIYAINHLPYPSTPHPSQNPSRTPRQTPHAASRIEIFTHTLGTTTAHHIRSISHPSISTPNDLYATSPNSFYVTNDHYYRSGPLRLVESVLGSRGFGAWSSTVFVTFEGSVGGAGSGGNGGDASEGVKVEEALGGLHNNNGLGRGERGDVVLIGSAASGELTVARRSERSENNGGEAGEEAKLTPIEHIQLETTIDNPSYFKDEFATPEDDASGYVLAGLVRAVDLPKDVDKVGGVVPSLVQILRRNETAVARGGDGTTMGTGPGEKRGEDRGGDVSRKDKAWAKPKVVFQDDGKRVSGAATAVLVGVDPKETGGRKKGWLFVTGFMTNSVVATLIDL